MSPNNIRLVVKPFSVHEYRYCCRGVCLLIVFYERGRCLRGAAFLGLNALGFTLVAGGAPVLTGAATASTACLKLQEQLAGGMSRGGLASLH